ncbi:hypothetical protein G9A89_006382 [Geosiphon pyriformis]|nr:hypothetical protein G9A89_006382 [Geosiphon pyriformis]
MVKKTKSSEKWEQSLASAIITPNSFVIPNEISIASSSMLSKISQDQPLAVLLNVVSFSKSLPVLEAKQSSSVKSPVLRNWVNQIETELFPLLVFGTTFDGTWKTITSCQKFAGWVTSTLVLGATFKIKLAYVKAVFQSVHGFLGVNSVHLATLKIAKFLVIFESGSPFTAVVLHDVLLNMFTIDIKMTLSVFVSIICVVLKPAGIWQYVVNPLSGKSNKTILSHNKFKTKLSGHYFQFALVTFDSQADLDSTIVKTNCKISLSPPLKFSKVFTPHFVGSKSYAKTSASLNSPEFPLLLPFVSSPVIFKSDLTKLSALVKSIVKSIGSLVTTFEQFINNNLVLSSALDLKINKILVHMSFFSRTVDKLEREVVSLKKECYIEDIDMSGDSELLPVVSDEMFFNLMSLWEHKSVDVKTNLFKTTK